MADSHICRCYSTTNNKPFIGKYCDIDKCSINNNKKKKYKTRQRLLRWRKRVHNTYPTSGYLRKRVHNTYPTSGCVACGSNGDFVVVVIPSGVGGYVSDVKTELPDITTETETQAVLVECCFTSTETVGLLGTGSPGRPPRLSHSS